MTVVQCRLIDCESRVGIKYDEVGIVARGDLALAAREADELGGIAAHPARKIGESKPAAAGFGPDGRLGEL
jgi:hypothetical protein